MTHRSSIPFHFLLFAICPVIHMAANNPGQASGSSTLLAAAVVLLAAAVTGLILFFVLKSWEKSAIATVFLIALTIAYGPVHGHIEYQLINQDNAGSQSTIHWKLSIAWLAAFLLLLLPTALLKAGMLAKATRFLNIMSVIFTALLMVPAITGLQKTPNENTPEKVATATEKADASAQNPDIYLVILDGYARKDTLINHYGYDNSDFEESLARRGFHINHESHSNYHWTFLSLGSTLNYNYWPDIINLPPQNKKDRSVAYHALRKNAASAFLKDRGYRFIHFESTWSGTQTNPYADETVSCHQGMFKHDFYRALVDASWLKALQNKAGSDLANCHLANLDSLAEMGRKPGPKFVFAHFIPPHHPYLFDEQGNILREATLSDQFDFQKRLWEDRAAYVSQLRFMNRKILGVLDTLIADSPAPPIILLLSDHGPNISRHLSDQERLQTRFSNFAAYLTPGMPHNLPAGGTSVNLFRHLFNRYFDANLDILPDKHYASPVSSPFAFQEIDGESFLPVPE